MTEPAAERLSVEVDRSRWFRGRGLNGSALVRSADGTQCCVGFMCLAAGAPREDLVDVGSPSDIARHYPGKKNIARIGPWDLDSNSEELYVAFEINDAWIGWRPDLGSDTSARYAEFVNRPIEDEADREDRLARLCAVMGVDLVFTDESAAEVAS